MPRPKATLHTPAGEPSGPAPGQPETADPAPGPFNLEVRYGLPGQEKVTFRQRVYKMQPIDQQPDKVVIIGALRPTEVVAANED